MVLDLEKRTLRFSLEKFMTELEETMSHFEEPEYFDISDTYSVVYKKFLQLDFSNRPAIRGQLEGPISFGLNVHDQDNRPILFDDTVRPFMLEFMAKRVNVQLTRLKASIPTPSCSSMSRGCSSCSAPWQVTETGRRGRTWRPFSP